MIDLCVNKCTNKIKSKTLKKFCVFLVTEIKWFVHKQYLHTGQGQTTLYPSKYQITVLNARGFFSAESWLKVSD